MIKFTLGLAIIAFTLIVGAYKYFENNDLISARERGLRSAQKRLEESANLAAELTSIKDYAMPSGEDQKFNIERMLGIGAPGMEFTFLGQSRVTGAEAVYRHNYKISGMSTFTELMALLEDIISRPGFTITKICFACGRSAQSDETNTYFVIIEGLLYVYDPQVVEGLGA